MSTFLSLGNVAVSPGVPLEEKLNCLRAILTEMQSVVIGFSGGADSALLAYVAHEQLGDRAYAVMALSESYPQRERDEAAAFATALHIPLLEVLTEEVANEAYASNPPNRCYYCKQELFKHLKRVADANKVRWVAYGANHDDLADYRPGQIAAKEVGARAPLIEAGLTKPEIRHISRDLGLVTWNKPALACLSSRFPYGTRITPERLSQVEQAEDYLRHDLGFLQVRVRHHDTIARIELAPDDMSRILDPELRTRISDKLKSFGYQFVALELTGYKSGSMNAAIAAAATTGH